MDRPTDEGYRADAAAMREPDRSDESRLRAERDAALARVGALEAACEDMLPLLEHAERCEASADDGYGERLRSLRRRLAAARAARAALAGAPPAPEED